MIPVGVLAASLSALCYGLTPACARRSIRLLGFARANVWRLALAWVVVATSALVSDRGVGDQAATFALAGAVGFGVGGFAMFRALPLLGAPLSSLIVETVAALVAGALAWGWFADAVSLPSVVCSLLMLAGVAIGLLPYARGDGHHPRLGLGVVFALIAAVAQGVSAALSRRGLLAVQQAGAARGERVSVGTSFDYVLPAASDRLAGGLVVALLLLALAVAVRTRTAWARAALTPASRGAERGAVWTSPPSRTGRAVPDRAWFWVGANTLVGPVLGVTSMVWALQHLQPGVAQAIAALAPLIAIPAARWLEGYRPPTRYAFGAVIAVTGLAGLALG